MAIGLRSRKRVAAFVLIAGVATLLAGWGVAQRGEKVKTGKDWECDALELPGLMARLELASNPDELEAALTRAPAPCVREAATSMTAADWALLVSYGLFLAVMFVLLANLRAGDPRQSRVWQVWVVGGAALAAVAMLADAAENWLLLRALTPAGTAADLVATLAALRTATLVKWGALAVAAAAAAVLWLWRSRRPANARPEEKTGPSERRIAWLGLWASRLVAVLGLAAAAVLVSVLVAAFVAGDVEVAVGRLLLGQVLLVAFLACAFLRAIGVAAEPAALPALEAAAAEGREEECVPPAGVFPAAGSLYERAYPRELLQEEWRLVCARRKSAGVPPEGPRVGFGLSGGGIRSATVDLGIFQGLAELALAEKAAPTDPAPEEPAAPDRRVLERIDFVSTVSGGGYFGSFLGRLWTRRFVEGPGDVARALRGASKEGRSVLGYLRENGRYLSPNGAGDMLFGAAVALRNWVAVQLVLVTALLTIFLGLQVARPGLDLAADRLPPSIGCYFDLAGPSFWWSPWLLLPLLAFVLVAFPFGWAYWMVDPQGPAFPGAEEGRSLRRRLARDFEWDRSAIKPIAGLGLTFFAALILVFGPWRPAARAVCGLIALTAALTYGCYWLAAELARRQALRQEEKDAKGAGDTDSMSAGIPTETERQIDRRIQRQATQRQLLSTWLTGALIVTALLLALGLVDSLGQSLYVALLGPDPWSGWIAGLFSALVVVAGYARRIAVFFSKDGGKDKRPSLPVNLIAGLAALLLVTLLLVCFNAASHAVAWRLSAPIGSPQWRAAASDCVTAGAAKPCSPAALAKRDCGEGNAPRLRDRRDAALPAIALIFGFVLSVFFGQTFPFVNRSSFHALYSSRLTRAYLGASNRRRWTESVTRVIRGDDCDLMRYWPPPSRKAAPIHLINVTVNETVSGQSQVEQKDRKGTNLALGPYGLSLGVVHHAVIGLGEVDPVGRPVVVYPENEETFRAFEYPRDASGRPFFAGETLPLGSWVGISGAAFSTGVGARTSLGLSLLTGFGNVRLGRWWDSGVDVASRRGAVTPTTLVHLEHAVARLFPVQVFLFDEFLARFHGTARRHWYLSDGGHFENLAGYELIRRRLPMMVIVDAEEDADFTFGGLSNLIRKARIDFGAEITFLDEQQLSHEIDGELRDVVGTLEELRRGSWVKVPPTEHVAPAESAAPTENVAPTENATAAKKEPWPRWRLTAADSAGFSRAHAALAWVTYADEPGRRSRLLYIKATMTGDETADLVEYHRAHPAFPHEPTTDQFFDEAQWESYRKLGEHIARRLFRRPAAAAGPSPQAWWPDELA